MVKLAYSSSCLSNNFNHTLIRLIQKVADLTTIVDFWLISLLNVSLKIITKVFVNRIFLLLDDIISPNQSSFLPGRDTNNNVLGPRNDAFVKAEKGGTGVMAIKVDFSKAYDKLSWEYICNTLMELNLPAKWVSLIMNVVSTPSLQVMWNNKVKKPFSLSRGIR